MLAPFLSTAQSSRPFITTWKTDNRGPSPSTQITIPTNPNLTYNYSVDWGDGTNSTNITGDITHTYTNIGTTYQVAITGDFPAIQFRSPQNANHNRIISVNQWGDVEWRSFKNAFASCQNLTVTATDTPNLTGVEDMSGMFKRCRKLVGNSSFNNWNLSNVTNTKEMFLSARNFTADIGDWNVSNVTNMESMFNYAEYFNADIGRWNVSNVTTMKKMFTKARKFNQNIGNWNVSHVTDMRGMFGSASSFNQDIGNWNVSNLTEIESMFNGAGRFNQNINNWDIRKIIHLDAVFAYAQNFNQPLDRWDVSNVKTMKLLFYEAHPFNQDISSWDVGNVEDMEGTFLAATSFNQNINSWNVANVTNMKSMFDHAYEFNQDLSNWDVSKVTSMKRMFNRAFYFDQNLGTWNIQSLTDATDMFNQTSLSTCNYDSLLLGWVDKLLVQHVPFSAENTQYNKGEAARNKLINNYNWTIQDDGKIDFTHAQEQNDVTSCTSYTLPPLSADSTYYTQTMAGGEILQAGDEITSSKTIYIYTGNGSCLYESSFEVAILNTVTADELADVSTCNSYTLPQLSSDNNYYTETMAGGELLHAGDEITADSTLYIYTENGNCHDQSSFDITIVNVQVDQLADVSACNSYTLPQLSSNNNYYTETMAGGELLHAGDEITADSTLYIYAENGNCHDESFFDITIVNVQVDELADVSTCNSYTLPQLSGNNNYYTETMAGGELLHAGDEITYSQTLYIYAENGNCYDESSFEITISDTVNIDQPNDVSSCKNYVLPVLTHGNYFSDANGEGQSLFAGDTITTSRTIYIYAESANERCTANHSFSVTIDPTECMDAQNQCNAIFPTFITPNGDGINDRFTTIQNDCNTVGTLHIYDRYGKLVYFTANFNKSNWNGSLNGVQLPTSDYWYMVTLEGQDPIKGHFTLKR